MKPNPKTKALVDDFANVISMIALCMDRAMDPEVPSGVASAIMGSLLTGALALGKVTGVVRSEEDFVRLARLAYADEKPPFSAVKVAGDA